MIIKKRRKEKRKSFGRLLQQWKLNSLERCYSANTYCSTCYARTSISENSMKMVIKKGDNPVYEHLPGSVAFPLACVSSVVSQVVNHER